MSLSINDLLSPALREKLARISDKRPILLAAGAALAGIATRAFRDPSLRTSEWAPLKASTLKRKKGGGPLIDTGALFHSIIAQPPASSSVEVGTDRNYALFHQFGTRKMDARPFFPVVGSDLTDKAERSVRSAVEGQLNALLR